MRNKRLLYFDDVSLISKNDGTWSMDDKDVCYKLDQSICEDFKITFIHEVEDG